MRGTLVLWVIFLQERKPTISKELNGLSISQSLSKMAYARLLWYRRWCIALLKSHYNHNQVSIVVTNEICKITMMKVAGAYLGFVNTITMTWHGCHSVSNQMQIKPSHYWPLASGTHQWSNKAFLYHGILPCNVEVIVSTLEKDSVKILYSNFFTPIPNSMRIFYYIIPLATMDVNRTRKGFFYLSESVR